MDDDIEMGDTAQEVIIEETITLPQQQQQRKPVNMNNTLAPNVTRSQVIIKPQAQPVPSVTQSLDTFVLPQQQQTKGDIMLLSNAGKDARAKRQVKQRWYFDTEPRVELIEQLKQEMQPCVSPMLFSKLFSSNFKTQVEAISVLYESLPNQVSELGDCLDLLLKYCSLRIFEASNTALIIRVLELVQRIFQILVEQNYQLSEYESGVFFPIFIDKLGHNIGTVRETMRHVLKLGRSICNPRRLFLYILEGTKTKNSRVRTDCLIELADMIDQYGDKVCSSSTFVIVARCIGDVDTVRTAALAVIQSAFKFYGNQIWSLLGNDLPESHKQMIEEKLKKKGTTNLSSQNIVKQPQQLTRTNSDAEFKVDDYEDDYKVTRVEADTTLSPTMTRTVNSSNTTQRVVDISNLDLTQAASLKVLISAISVEPSQLDVSVQALRKIADIIAEGKTTVVPYLQELVECLAMNIHLAFERAGARIIPVRICKYLLNTTMQLFAKRTLVEFVSKDNVQLMTDELLQRLLDSELPNLEDGQQLLQALNTLMLKLLENTNRTHAYTALLQLLSQTHENPSKQRYIELVVKCLLKLTKALQTTIDRLQIDILLMDLHEFLTQNPPTMFKQKDDLPLRTVKTILNELVKSLGPSIRTHMSLIPTHKSPLIVSYIELMLTSQQQRANGGEESIKTSVDLGTTQQLNRSTPQQQPHQQHQPPQRSDEEINSILTNIFSLIGSKDTTQKGLMALYKFQKTYSMERVQDHLARCSEPFQKYILRQLSKLEAHEAGQLQTQQPKSRPQSIDLSNGVQVTQTTPTSIQRPSLMSSVDTARMEMKLKQQQQTVARSDSVANIINRIKVPKQPESSNAPAVSESSDLEALRKRIRAKTTQSYTPTESTPSPVDLSSTTSTVSADLGGNSLRARMLATLSRVKDNKDNKDKEDEKENLNTNSAQIKERVAKLAQQQQQQQQQQNA
jgi:cytoskeleton-associated protein 5